MKSIIIGIQGGKGSFSEEAAKTYVKKHGILNTWYAKKTGMLKTWYAKKLVC